MCGLEVQYAYIDRCYHFQVRRTRISERMRKLQELVPHMDKVKYSIFIFFLVAAPIILLIL